MAIEDAASERKRWTVGEVERMFETGVLNSEKLRYELLDGEVLCKWGQNHPHIAALRLVVAALREAFGDTFDVNAQLPLRLGDFDRPEPDVTVLRGTAREFAHREPTSADVTLLVEVADSRLDTARGAKVEIYARHAIAEYWIVDLRKRTVEARRTPRPDISAWGETRLYTEGDRLSPIGAANASVSVADLLPPSV